MQLGTLSRRMNSWITCIVVCGYVIVFAGVMKDLVGMLGGICFSLVQGSGLDSNAKQWRYFADCMNNIGMVLNGTCMGCYSLSAFD